ncbi:unnamed protein product, partial [Mycena citricolor]
KTYQHVSKVPFFVRTMCNFKERKKQDYFISAHQIRQQSCLAPITTELSLSKRFWQVRQSVRCIDGCEDKFVDAHKAKTGKGSRKDMHVTLSCRLFLTRTLPRLVSPPERHSRLLRRTMPLGRISALGSLDLKSSRTSGTCRTHSSATGSHLSARSGP